MRGLSWTLTTEIFPLITYLLVITNSLHLRAFQSNGQFAFIKTEFSAATTIFILCEWLLFCYFLHLHEQSLKHPGWPKKKKKSKPLESPPLVSLHAFCSPLNCTATMLLRAELEIKESEGLANNTQLFPLTSKRLTRAFGLLLREGGERGTPFPVSWLCFLYSMQFYCHWLAYFSCAFVAVHTNHSWLWLSLRNTQTDTIGYAERFELCCAWPSSRKSFIQSPSSAGVTPSELQDNHVSPEAWALLLSCSCGIHISGCLWNWRSDWPVLTADCHFPCLK